MDKYFADYLESRIRYIVSEFVIDFEKRAYRAMVEKRDEHKLPDNYWEWMAAHEMLQAFVDQPYYTSKSDVKDAIHRYIPEIAEALYDSEKGGD